MNEAKAFPGSEGRRWQRRLLISGVVSLGLCALGAIFEVEQFLRSYLFAYFAWLGMTVGSLALWMLHNLTGGAWGFVLRRIWEAASRTLPLMALLFVPIALGVKVLYPWASMDVRELGHKADFLNVPFFLARMAAYLGVWLGVEFVLHRWSVAHERTGDLTFVNRAEQLSGPGLVLLGLTVTFASIDWVMSLEPDWSSTIFGALVAAGFLLAALGLAIGVATVGCVATHPTSCDAGLKVIWNDLGNLLLAFVMMWTYLAFSQFLLIWSGNLPEEITWYLHRTEGGWQWLGLALAAGYFALPFCLLLSRDVKRNPARLRMVAFLVVSMSVVHHYWLIAPALSPGQLRVHWLDLAALIGFGGLWLSQFLRQLQARPLLFAPEPSVKETLHA
jgi:hypothetical protein